MSTDQRPEPLPDPRPRCQGTKKSGAPCGAPATVNGTHCPWHSGKYTAEDRTEWALRGSATTNRRVLVKKLAQAQITQEEQDAVLQLPDLSSDTKVETYLTKTIAKVEAGLLPPSIANSIKGLLEIRLRLVELAVSKQIAELEAELRGVR